LIAATALAADLPLFIRNASDFADFDDLLAVTSVP
jgi:predicted nucleic acid-binding protein